MADILVVSLFETKKLWKLHPTQTLPFVSSLVNSAHAMDGSTLFITQQLSIYVQFHHVLRTHILNNVWLQPILIFMTILLSYLVMNIWILLYSHLLK